MINRIYLVVSRRYILPCPRSSDSLRPPCELWFTPASGRISAILRHAYLRGACRIYFSSFEKSAPLKSRPVWPQRSGGSRGSSSSGARKPRYFDSFFCEKL